MSSYEFEVSAEHQQNRLPVGIRTSQLLSGISRPSERCRQYPPTLTGRRAPAMKLSQPTSSCSASASI
eukprot:scaffold15184_cov38-Prasinocladus_malaysianus.AAC.1